MGGYSSLPIGGGSAISPERCPSHSVKSSHQVPSCSSALSSHSSAVSKEPQPSSVVKYPLPFGSTTPAMCPPSARTKRMSPLVSLQIAHPDFQGAMWSFLVPAAYISPVIRPK